MIKFLPKRMKKKAVEVGRYAVLVLIILLAVAIVMIIIYKQSGGVMSAYLDKIFT